MQSKNFHKQRMSSAIATFIKNLENYPGWRDWKRKKFGYTLYFDDSPQPIELVEEFGFSEKIEKQHSVIMCYLSLNITSSNLRNIEYYFRRFPYAKTPITRSDHLSNFCELYFSRIYQYRERLKTLFDTVEDAVGKHNLEIGKFIKRFDREFDAEIRARNSIHHRKRYEDIDTSRVFLIESMLLSDPLMSSKGWATEQRRAYQKAAKAWANRCISKSKRLDEFTEAVAEALLKVCSFLEDPSNFSGATNTDD